MDMCNEVRWVPVSSVSIHITNFLLASSLSNLVHYLLVHSTPLSSPSEVHIVDNSGFLQRELPLNILYIGFLSKGKFSPYPISIPPS